MQDSNSYKLAMPPRKIPFSIKMQLIFSSYLSVTLPMIALIFGPMYYIALIMESDTAKIMLLVFYALFAVSVATALIKGIKDLRIFTDGILLKAKVIDKYTINYDSETRTRFIVVEYYVNGKTLVYKYYKPMSLTQNTKMLESGATTPILCLQDKPEKVVLVDSYQTRIIVNEDGNLRMKHPIIGYLHYSLSVISIVLIAIECYAYLALGANLPVWIEAFLRLHTKR